MGNVLIRGGTIVTAERSFVGDVLIRDGRIEAIAEKHRAREGDGVAAVGHSPDGDFGVLAVDPGVRVLDATGKLVLPGLIDVHVHFRQPGLTDKEDFASGTLAAACGGVTTVLDMPNTLPPVGTAAIWREKADSVLGRAYVDYGIYGLIDEHNLDQLEPLAEAGVAAFKLFLGPTTGDLRAPDRGRLMEVFETVRQLGLPLVVHAEDRDVIEYWTERVERDRWGVDPAERDRAATNRAERDRAAETPPGSCSFTYTDFLATRPAFGEVAAIQTVCLLARMTDTPIHIAHVTLHEAVRVIAEAKAAGTPVTAETCPPYLTMTEADCERLGPVSKILPPIRGDEDRDALWAGLHDGTIDLIATDHAPHEDAVKAGHNWLTAAGGMIGVETMLPVLLNEVHNGRLALTDLVRWTSTRPAEVFGLAERKGDLRAGLDGDVVVVDPQREFVVEADRLHSKSANSALLGETLRGAVVHTVLRGRVVVEDGRPVGEREGRRLG